MKGKTIRFVNFLLDTLIYLVVMIIFTWGFRNVIPRENIRWISVLFYFLYYFLFEYIRKQTPGKMITQTEVSGLMGNNNYYFIQIFLRTLMRFIPIDILSYLFSYRGLHDWISKTTIIKR